MRSMLSFCGVGVILATGLLLGGCPSGGDGGGGSGDDPIKGQTTQQSLNSGGLDRSFVIHVPGKYDGTAPVQFVLLLHGTGQDGQTYLDNAGWADKSDAEGFIIVAPNALPLQRDKEESLTNPSLWDFAVLGSGESSDAKFIDAVLADTVSKYSVDAKRTYCVGHSSGGGMTFLMGILRKDTFAGIGIVASPFIGVSTNIGNTMPTIYIQGTADPIVPVTGGDGGLLGALVPPLETTLSGWAAVLGCAATRAVVSNEGGVEFSQYSACAGSAPFQVHLIEGQGHKWPGFNVPNSPGFVVRPTVDSLNATDAIWSFLSDKSK